MGRLWEGEDWGGKYRTEVRNGARPVGVKAEPMWEKWCKMNKGREVHVEGVRIKRKGSIVWIAGKRERTVSQTGGQGGTSDWRDMEGT